MCISKRGTRYFCCFFFQAEDGIRDIGVTGVQTCALPISAATDESTPPDNAQITFLSPTVSFIFFICSSAKEDIDQSPFSLQTSNKKFLSICFPNKVCSTSGWNCTPYNFLSSFAIAAHGHSLVVAIISNPAGRSEEHTSELQSRQYLV